ncbi:MAG: hypothetical protein V4772_25315 [Pseudomonadota bacterium]
MIGQILRFVLKLVLGLFAAIFAVSLIVAAVLVLIFSRIKALLTGKKPEPMVFARFQRFSPQGMWPGAAAAREAADQNGKPGDVVDVEAREIRDDKRLN